MFMSERRKRCFEAFQKTGLDGLLFASGPSFQYLAECTSYFWQRNCGNSHARIAGAHIIPEAMIYMNKEGKTTILTSPSLKDHFDIVKMRLSSVIWISLKMSFPVSSTVKRSASAGIAMNG